MVIKRESRFNYTFFFLALISVLFLTVVVLTSRLLSLEQNVRTEYIVLNRDSSKGVVYDKPHRLAVLVPFRDRFEELLVFAPYISNFLNDQHINHDIFILNQVDGYRFNRASLINVGYLFTKADYDYVAMHDVDLLPLNKNLSYDYPKEQPFHVAAPHLHPRYHYSKFVGGILLVKREHFQLVNGMSNKYWGWGLEDDEFYVRLRDAHLNVTRPTNILTGMNDTFKHIHDKNHRKRDTVKCFNQREVTRKRDRHTGLHDVKYKILAVHNLTVDSTPVTVVNIQLTCDKAVTPWCDCSDKK
ncbi:PREDICTED: beta-1,4-galactosyltransferase 7 [Nicrophorus vespilloides]|uniref:Beta-1,4-galactosyltransferase 7 n=1 Tax=Nicrophorus vespilloides TaxID=110193 RepID=A0ABM1MRB8_NICVS|nr:PREDICTED: beta-1,4-galactosyltransferase 7 [Nicrophorus vespilloides]